MKKVTKKELEAAHEALQEAKAAYKEWDSIIERMIALGITEIKTSKGIFRLVDQFADKNTVWKPASVKRYDLKKEA